MAVGYVYLLRMSAADNVYKVGRTNNLGVRLRAYPPTVQCVNFREVRCPMAVEKNLVKRFVEQQSFTRLKKEYFRVPWIFSSMDVNEMWVDVVRRWSSVNTLWVDGVRYDNVVFMIA
tara:strand:- start:503 stop:853 length:351 start_codon:yes stop_codon:yes gene_type:complete